MKRAAFIFIIATLLAFLSCCVKKAEDPFVVKIGTEKVYSPEFCFYFLLSQMAYEIEGGQDIWLTTINGVKAEEVAKDRTFESIARVKISGMQASSLGIKLTEADMEDAKDMAAHYQSTLNAGDLAEIGITPEQLEKIMQETIVYGKIFNEITDNVQISEKDFNVYYEGYITDTQNEIKMEDDLITLRDELRLKYSAKMKNEVFAGEYSKWEAEVETVKNLEVWDGIHVLRH